MNAFRYMACVGLACMMTLSGVRAEVPQPAIPYLFSPDVRAEKPDLEGRRVVRFITSNDFPPFQSLVSGDTPVGYHVDLARALCAELEKPCSLQAMPWEDMLGLLRNGRVDAVIAGHRPTPQLWRDVDFTHVYFRIPARFAVQDSSPLIHTAPEDMAGKTIAVVAGSAHEAFLQAYFPKSTLKSLKTMQDVETAVLENKADALFADGIRLAQWMDRGTGTCCKMVGEAYFESRFFGEGMAIAVRKGDTEVTNALNYALATLEARGVLSEIYLRWFPVGIY